MKFTSTFAVLVLAAAGVAADFASFKVETRGIHTSVNDLSTLLVATQGASYAEALKIDAAAKKLNNDLKTATGNAPKTITKAQGYALLTILGQTYQNVTVISQRLQDLQPVWTQKGIAGIVKSDISALVASIKSFGGTLVTAAPESLKAPANKLVTKYLVSVNAALAVY
ncbi:hypothetical protein OC834_002785 [Tilletia horrida]|uniref:Uncharacterized protein n=1 Tax=Tilletia horrida TaxID=155126 RepID=A0AAN6JNF6_9BASI|nr:hypothetical protein OC834_002785 [Tilletia horrida]KAK0537952.1 hypothetical protein OC842_001459 [Tilletia horrida]KAK0566741.1 hypothetical protein OC844_000575 [Tilletia horrida]